MKTTFPETAYHPAFRDGFYRHFRDGNLIFKVVLMQAEINFGNSFSEFEYTEIPIYFSPINDLPPQAGIEILITGMKVNLYLLSLLDPKPPPVTSKVEIADNCHM